MSDQRGSRFFEGLVFGGLLGLVAGLLIAPRTGEETRRLIGRRIHEALTQFDQVMQEGRDAIEIAIAEGKEAAECERQDTRVAFEQVLDNLEDPK